MPLVWSPSTPWRDGPLNFLGRLGSLKMNSYSSKAYTLNSIFAV